MKTRFQPKLKIRKNDTVIVISGEDKGKKGRVLEVYPEKQRVLIEGVKIIHRHTKKASAENPDGGIVKKEAPIHISNVLIADPKTGKASKVGRKELNGKIVRYAKKSGEVIK